MRHPLKVSNLSKFFGRNSVLEGIDFFVKENTILAVVGESGSGKTTLMRIIAGLEKPDSGSVFSLGKDVTSLPPNKRSVGLVFQEYALFPHLTVAKNIAYGVKKKKAKRVSEMLELIHLPDIGERYPYQLSGGQQQRVAIARAMAPDPSLLLLDEPFSNLDPIRRCDLRHRIKSLVEKSETTVMIVTHDIEDALKIATKILILKEGKIVQCDSPAKIIAEPANDYVRALIG